jgi:tetratricopeptide (TPR) repeat protein
MYSQTVKIPSSLGSDLINFSNRNGKGIPVVMVTPVPISMRKKERESKVSLVPKLSDIGQILPSVEGTLGVRYHAGFAQRLLGEIALKTNPTQAAPHFEKSIAVLREIKAENELALAYAGFGRLHKQQGQIAQAREYLTKALEIFERLGTLIEPDKVRKELAELPKEG